MKKYALLFFLLLLISGCSKTSADILPNSTATVISSTEAVYMVSTPVPHEPTATPFPPLGDVPSGQLAFVVGGDVEELHITNGIGDDNNVISPPYNINEISHPVWSPNNEYITFNCSYTDVENKEKILQLCFLEVEYLEAEDIINHIITIEIGRSTQEIAYIVSYSWAPDASMLVVNLYSGNLCVVTVSSRTTDCSSSNYILNGFLKEDVQRLLSPYSSAVWSPTEMDMLVISSSRTGEIILVDNSKKTLNTLTTLPYLGDEISFSPSGEQIAFTYKRESVSPDLVCRNQSCLYPSDGIPMLGATNIDGTGYQDIVDGIDVFYQMPTHIVEYYFPTISTTPSLYRFNSPSWSPDGRFIAFNVVVARGQSPAGIGWPKSSAYQIDLATSYFYPLWDFQLNYSSPSWSSK